MSIDPKTLLSLNEMYDAMRSEIEHLQIAKKENPAADPQNLQLMVTAQDFWKEIRPKIASAEWFHIYIDGEPGSSKTTVMRELAHCAEQDGFANFYSSSFDILDAPVAMQSKVKGHRKICVMLDDMSYAVSTMSQKMQNKIKNFITLIRHAMETETVNPEIFFMVSAHFKTAVPPVLKNTNYWIFTAPKNQEQDIMLKLVGRKEQKRKQMQDMFDAVTQLQAAAAPGKVLKFTMYGKLFEFKWGDKDDPGDGRLHLIIKNGDALFYNSKRIDCPQCNKIGEKTRIKPEHYANTDKQNDIAEGD